MGFNEFEQVQAQDTEVIAIVVLSEKAHVKVLPSELTVHLNAISHNGAHTELKLGQVMANDELHINRYLKNTKAPQQFMILEVNAEQSSWRDGCLNMADKVLLLVDSNEPFSLLTSEFHQLIAGRAELVICHEDIHARPRDTARFLAHYKTQRHHHIRTMSSGDVKRLARDLSGQSIAVVLGGGGARSFVHIGVLKAMGELGIPVDRIGGTSMGAIIAAQYAAGHTPEQLRDINHDVWVRGKPHKAFTLPMTSLLSARRAKKLTQQVFAERHVEDLWLDFFCVSCDLTHLKTHIHDRGMLWSALLASGAIPGVCSSIVSENGSVLVDGGVLDNLPVEAMLLRHNGPVIAVDVTSSRGLQASNEGAIPPNGLQAFFDYINPFAKDKRYPHTLKLLSHTAALAAKVNAKESRALADLCITPTCHQFKAMDMRNLDQLVEQGYRDALPKLEKWLAI